MEAFLLSNTTKMQDNEVISEGHGYSVVGSWKDPPWISWIMPAPLIDHTMVIYCCGHVRYYNNRAKNINSKGHNFFQLPSYDLFHLLLTCSIFFWPIPSFDLFHFFCFFFWPVLSSFDLFLHLLTCSFFWPVSSFEVSFFWTVSSFDLSMWCVCVLRTFWHQYTGAPGAF